MDHYQLQSFPPRSQWSAAAVAQRDNPGARFHQRGLPGGRRPWVLSAELNSTGRMGLHLGLDKSRRPCARPGPSPPPPGRHCALSPIPGEALRPGPGPSPTPPGRHWALSPIPGEALRPGLGPSPPSRGQLVLHMWIFSKSLHLLEPQSSHP